MASKTCIDMEKLCKATKYEMNNTNIIIQMHIIISDAYNINT